MKKITRLYALVLVLLLNACDTKNIRNYSILETSTNDKSKFTVSVKIDDKYLEDDLINISAKVKSEIDAISQRGTVFFLLPEMSIGNGAWASIQFPELTVTYFGTVADDKINSSNQENQEYFSEKKYIGIWIDNYSKDGVLIGIREDRNEGYLKEYIDPNTLEVSTLSTSLVKIKKKGKVIFKDEDSIAGEYFILEKNGNLSAYDNQGYILTYKNKAL